MSDADSEVDLGEFDDFDPAIDVDPGVDPDAEVDLDLDVGDDGAELDSDPELDDEEEVIISPKYRVVPRKVDTFARLSNHHWEVIIVPPEDRITDNCLQQLEAARLIAVRAAQIEKYPRVFTNCTGLTHAIDMARKELIDRRCPLLLRRRVGSDPGTLKLYVEEWNPREMVIPSGLGEPRSVARPGTGGGYAN